MNLLQKLRKAKSALVESVEKLNAELNGDGVTAEREQQLQSEIDAKMGEIKGLNKKIAIQEAITEERRSMDGTDISDDADISGGEPASAKDPKRGFKSFGEFSAALVRASQPSAAIDQRLLVLGAAPTTYGNEGSGADGGFLVPPEFSREIWSHSLEQDSFIPLTDNTEISGNSMVFPKDETTPWGSDGVRAYWEGEAAAATQTKGVFGQASLRLKKLIALVPATDELMADAPALGTYLVRKTGESIRWKANDAIINGNGVGQPLGLMSHASQVAVAKESGQAADTVNVTNVAKMYARMPAESLRRAVWLINQDVLPQLITMVLNNQPIYTPPGGLSNAPYGTLLGRPILITQHAKTVGDLGDIQFVDFMKYRTITKRGGIETATSIHLYFDAAATAFRAIFRIDGQPSLASAITPANGSDSLSPFVALAARA